MNVFFDASSAVFGPFLSLYIAGVADRRVINNNNNNSDSKCHNLCDKSKFIDFINVEVCGWSLFF